MNVGGWLLLTIIFSVLLLIVQRAEWKRRIVTALIMLFVGIIVWRYALYALGRSCALSWQVLCSTLIIRQQQNMIASQTIMWAVLSSLLVNILYWALFGRYNPVGSSDAIKVIGMYD